MRRFLSLLALALAFGAALPFASCGGEDARLLPGETAREITVNLNSVQQLADEGDCLGAESAAQQVGEQVEALEGIDPKLKEALQDGVERLKEVVVTCEEEPAETERPEAPPAEAEEDEQDDEKEEAREEKEREAEEKQQEKEEEAREKEEERESPEPPPAEPPGLEEEGEAEEGESETPSGGVSPGDAVEGR